MARHVEIEWIETELRELGTTIGIGKTLTDVARKYKLGITEVSIHRSKHMGLDPLPRGRTGGMVTERMTLAAPVASPPLKAKPETIRISDDPAAKSAHLVKTIATLIQLGSYRGHSTLRALASRHNVSEAEASRCYRLAALRVKDGRGSTREQIELSVGVLTTIRDAERKVAEEYTGIAERIVAPALPTATPRGVTIPPQRQASEEDLKKAALARSIAAQATDNAIAAQARIDQNTIHRKTAPLIQLSFSADPNFGRAQDALIELVDAWIGNLIPDIRQRLETGMAVLEDGGEAAFQAHLAEVRDDRAAILGSGETVEEGIGIVTS